MEEERWWLVLATSFHYAPFDVQRAEEEGLDRFAMNRTHRARRSRSTLARLL
jgi:hypothetical protein